MPLTLAVWVGLASYAPFLIPHARNLAQRPHYQFFPFFLAGLAWLTWSRWRSAAWRLELTRPRCLRAGLLLALAMPLTAAATRLGSPWLGTVAWLLVGASALLAASPATRRDLLPVWGALFLLINPPFNLDRRLIQQLQHGVAQLASEQLDLFGFHHLPLGTTIAFPGRHLFVEEACSGIQSLFALVACTVLFAVWSRQGLLPFAVLVAAAAFWALLANVLRVVIVAVTLETTSVDLSVGWAHQLLGMAIFASAVGLMASTLTLVRAVLPSMHGSTPCRDIVVPVGSSRIEGSPPRTVADRADRADHAVLPTGSRPSTLGAIVLSTAFLCLGAWEIAQQRPAATPHSSRLAHQPTLAKITAQLLPETSGTWKRLDYSVSKNTSWSLYSHRWAYQTPRNTVIVSFDYPYTSPHDLTDCYQSLGWQIGQQRLGEGDGGGGIQLPWPYQTAELLKPVQQFGWLAFTSFDAQGNPLDPPLTASVFSWRGLANRLRRPSPRTAAAQEANQVQLLVQSDEAISNADRDDALRHFLEFRHILRSYWMGRAP